MYGKFPEGMEHAEDHVEDDPRKGQPSRPVPPQQQANSRNEGKQFRRLDGDRVRMPSQQLRKMSYETSHAYQQVQACHRNQDDWTFHQRPHRQGIQMLVRPQGGVLVSPAMEKSMPPSLTAIKQHMAQTNDLFNNEVFARRNFDALDQIYTADARILPPGGPMISGRIAIKKFWADMVQGAYATGAELTSVDVMQAGDGVVEIGRAVLTVAPPAQGTAQMEVKYVVYWRPEDERWKWHVDIWNTNA